MSKVVMTNFVIARAPHFHPVMFIGALGRSRKQTEDITPLAFPHLQFSPGFWETWDRTRALPSGEASTSSDC